VVNKDSQNSRNDLQGHVRSLVTALLNRAHKLHSTKPSIVTMSLSCSVSEILPLLYEIGVYVTKITLSCPSRRYGSGNSSSHVTFGHCN